MFSVCLCKAMKLLESGVWLREVGRSVLDHTSCEIRAQLGEVGGRYA